MLHDSIFALGFGGFFLGVLLVGWGGRPGSLLNTKTPSVLFFHKRVSVRIGSLITGISFLGLGVFTIVEPILDAIKNHSWQSWGWFPAGVMGLIYGLFSVMCLYLSGPYALFLDLDKRTYELTVGWPWSPKVKSGSFQNIKSIILKPRNRKLGGYSARMLWRDSRDEASFLLGRFPDCEQAEEFARNLSQTLNFSRTD